MRLELRFAQIGPLRGGCKSHGGSPPMIFRQEKKKYSRRRMDVSVIKPLTRLPSIGQKKKKRKKKKKKKEEEEKEEEEGEYRAIGNWEVSNFLFKFILFFSFFSIHFLFCYPLIAHYSAHSVFLVYPIVFHCVNCFVRIPSVFVCFLLSLFFFFFFFFFLLPY